ncbi:MAG: outer membrane lipoprotein-sorting protein [Desulfobacteraceae bacterium 4572_35.2]|nr:MAG: outer membrane lipoprotein-sorting protein [Desulfobacteraceae bacterium 4572_35.2]
MGRLVLTILLIIAVFPADGLCQTATDIVRASDEKMRGQSSFTEITMQIIRPDWLRTMKMRGWTKGEDYSLVLVLAPARDKGSSSLKRGKEMWNWVPRIERVIKIAPSMLGQSWMGSDFTNDDLINQSSIVVDYTHTILRQESFDSTPCWVIEATPLADAPVVWGKLVVWVSQSELNQRKVEFYDEFGDLINTMSSYELKVLGGRLIPTRMEMQPADKHGQKTVLSYSAAEFDFAIDDDFFSLDQMRELR